MATGIEIASPADHIEIVDLTMAVVAINGWNRIAIATRATPQAKSAKAAAA
jgi:hypothetical protein